MTSCVFEEGWSPTNPLRGLSMRAGVQPICLRHTVARCLQATTGVTTSKATMATVVARVQPLTLKSPSTWLRMGISVVLAPEVILALQVLQQLLLVVLMDLSVVALLVVLHRSVSAGRPSRLVL